MTETATIELARARVALSNAQRIELIAPLVSADAIYCSSAVGEYHGAADIAEMMRPSSGATRTHSGSAKTSAVAAASRPAARRFLTG